MERTPSVNLWLDNSDTEIRVNADYTSPYIWLRFGSNLTLTISKEQAEQLIADLQKSVVEVK